MPTALLANGAILLRFQAYVGVRDAGLLGNRNALWLESERQADVAWKLWLSKAVPGQKDLEDAPRHRWPRSRFSCASLPKCAWGVQAGICVVQPYQKGQLTNPYKGLLITQIYTLLRISQGGCCVLADFGEIWRDAKGCLFKDRNNPR